MINSIEGIEPKLRFEGDEADASVLKAELLKAGCSFYDAPSRSYKSSCVFYWAICDILRLQSTLLVVFN